MDFLNEPEDKKLHQDGHVRTLPVGTLAETEQSNRSLIETLDDFRS